MPKTVIIIPCYNEAERLPVKTFKNFVSRQTDISFLFVNDGSTDNTSTLLAELAGSSEKFQFLNLDKNSGKAEAVRQGVISAEDSFDYIGFWDADLATPLEEIPNFLKLFENTGFELVSGLRLARLGANVNRKLSRHYMGRVFATVVSNLLGIEVYDTQCGAKIFRRELGREIFQQPFCSRWLFDIEIFRRISLLYGKEKSAKVIYEYPLMNWNDVSGSKLKITDFMKAPFELMKIFFFNKS